MRSDGHWARQRAKPPLAQHLKAKGQSEKRVDFGAQQTKLQIQLLTLPLTSCVA